LFEKRVVSPTEMALVDSKAQSLQAKLDVAKAEEGQAAINLGYAELRSPFDGVVNRTPKKVGSMVEEGELLTTVTDVSSILVYFAVSEREYLQYRGGKEERASEVRLKLVDGTLHEKPGVIDTVETEFDRKTGTIAFRARFPNEALLVRHGSSVKVLVKTWLKGALTVPQKSTFEVQEHVYVYAVDEKNQVRSRRIIPRMRIDDAYVIESGLTVNDRFVLEGLQKVKEGATIVARP
jgi:membrane fusion protein (multidrug efflux system)